MSPKSASRDKQAIWRLTYKIIALILIPIIAFSTISYIESLSDRQIADLLEIFNFSKLGAPLNSALAAFLLLLFVFFAFFPLIRLMQKFFSALTGKYFVISLAALAVLGAVAALYIPSYTNWFKPDTQQSTSSTQNGQGSGNQQNQSSKDPSSDLRLHLLYITGGIIAVLGLIETNRKNSQDHIRQVHAARRDRYIEAVDKLSSEQAPVRLGGVYALVGLVDEWLDDDNIDRETQLKEGQVIINNLCSYIRSPFPLAEEIEEYEARKELEKLQKTESEKLSVEESLRLQILIKRFEDSGEYEKPKDITTDYAKFHEEQDVRRTIFVEMSKRSSTFTKNDKGEIIETVPGPWSDFDFDFSRAPIFYPLNAITIEKGIFSSAKFYSNAHFSEATFTQNADFSRAAFAQNADFSSATFTQTADFSWAAFTQNADFSSATFTQTANFSWAAFTQTAYFGEATFTQDAGFSGATFTQTAYFYEATFTQNAYFSGAAFTQDADFYGATFTQTARFSGATFTQDADFSRATFTQTANFSEATFSASSPKFVVISKVLERTFRARFATLPKNQEAHNFTVSKGSFRIPPGEAELGDGVKHHIPVGTILFDPDSWDEERQKYTRVSEPAKPIEESDNQGETPSK